MNDFTILSVFSTILGFVLIRGLLYYRSKWHETENLLKARKKDTELDLELATSEQLVAQLRDRQAKYIFLRPQHDDSGIFRLSIEISCVPPLEVVRMLGTSTNLIIQELKRQGMELPPMDAEEFTDE